MISNFFKIAIRSLLKHKLHALINILGLAIGMAATILITSYVFFELSYDKHNENYNDTYRIFNNLTLPNGSGLAAPATLGNTAPILKEQIPEIKYSVRFTGYREFDVEYGENTFTTDKFMWVDTSFFDVFTCKFIAGDPETALEARRSLIITKSYAKRIFGNEDAFNKTLKNGDNSYKITAVVEDMPLNSHFRFDLLGSFSTVCTKDYDITKNNGFNFMTYLVIPNLEKNKDFILQKTNKLINEGSYERFGVNGLDIKVEASFQPLKDIHLKSHSEFELDTNGDINNVYIFSALAIFILIIAIVNFVNLVTANSENRAKEIGLRKVMGAHRQNLFYQFIGESILTSLLAFIISMGITELFIGFFRELMDSPILIPYWSNLLVLGIIIMAVLIIGFISGTYPALYLSKFLPIKALKGSKSSGGAKNVFLRKTLVVFQFTIAIFLLINLGLLFKQVEYMKTKDLGFDKEQVLVVDNFTNAIARSYKSLKADLLTNPNIQKVSASQGVPGISASVEALYENGKAPSTSIAIIELRIQDDFIETYGIKIIDGEDYSSDMGTAKTKIILNEKAIKDLGLKDPINKKVVLFEDTLQIIGIIKNFHHQSLREEIAPMAITKRSSWFDKISVKINSQNVGSTLKQIEESFRKADPNNIFSYKFIDQSFAEMYQAEERSNKLITYAAILAIIISMLGLYALTSFTINQKTQEIGIRKVMGASVAQIVKMFITDLAKWVLIASLIASPLAYFSMKKWLDNFVYHIDIAWWMFILGIVIALVIAIFTVAFISIKAALSNPAESLKYE